MSKKILENKYLNYFAPIIWMVFIFFLASRTRFPRHLTPLDYQYISSLAHIFLYIVLTFLIANAFMTGKVKFKQALFYALIIAMAYGIFDEWRQAIVPWRHVRLSDWILDIVGCLVAGNLFWLKISIKENKEGKILGK